MIKISTLQLQEIVILKISLFVFLAAPLVYVRPAHASSAQSYTPPELVIADKDAKALVDSAENSAKSGNYEEVGKSLQSAIELTTRHKAVADKAIVESKLASFYFMQGKIEDAKLQWVSSLSDAISVSNLVLQADVLVALSSLLQVTGHLDQALDQTAQAVNLSKKAKNLYMESRALGELGRLELVANKIADARLSIEEALRIDRLNGYEWEAGHLLALAWSYMADSKLDKAIELTIAARDLATKNANYLVFVQSSLSLGQTYVHQGNVERGVGVLERARRGQSDNGTPVFQPLDGYLRTVSLPYFKVTFLEALGNAYQDAHREADALKSWQELYDIAATSGFTLAKAESSLKMADLHKARKEFDKAIEDYAIAASTWNAVGDEHRRIMALTGEATLLFQQNQKEKSLNIYKEIAPLAKASRNVSLQFIADLAIAEILDGTDRVEEAESSLKDAESLVGPDLSVPRVEPRYVVELYVRIAGYHEKHKNLQQQLLALEKALSPAVRWVPTPEFTSFQNAI